MMKSRNLLAPLLLTTLVLSACNNGLESGGSAGDAEETADAIALISPLVGLYDLPDNWEGVPPAGIAPTQAFLEVQQPNESGIATALLFRTNALNNCIETRQSSGDIFRDSFTGLVFFNDIFEFDRSVLSISGRNLVISLSEDVQDVDNDGDFEDSAELIAQRVDMMSSDLTFCQ